MSLEDLERRLKVLEDIEEIKLLKRRYCAYCDDNYDRRRPGQSVHRGRGLGWRDTGQSRRT